MNHTSSILLFLLCLSIASANDLYISTKGDDNNNCSLSLPCSSISHIAIIAIDGDIVHIDSGYYAVEPGLQINTSMTIIGAGSSIDKSSSGASIDKSSSGASIDKSSSGASIDKSSSGATFLLCAPQAPFAILTKSFVLKDLDVSSCYGAVVCKANADILIKNVNFYNNGGYTSENEVIGIIGSTVGCSIDISSSIITQCVDNEVVHGGAITNVNGIVSIRDSVISHCHAKFGGAVASSGVGSIVTINDTVLNANEATNGGGAIYLYNYAKLYMHGARVENNSVDVYGAAGALSCHTSEVFLNDNIVHSNSPVNIYCNSCTGCRECGPCYLVGGICGERGCECYNDARGHYGSSDCSKCLDNLTGHYSGPQCKDCAKGYSGANCTVLPPPIRKSRSTAWYFASIIAGVACILLLIGYAYHRKTSFHITDYKSLNSPIS